MWSEKNGRTNTKHQNTKKQLKLTLTMILRSNNISTLYKLTIDPLRLEPPFNNNYKVTSAAKDRY